VLKDKDLRFIVGFEFLWILENLKESIAQMLKNQ
jgi:hypothetical protein